MEGNGPERYTPGAGTRSPGKREACERGLGKDWGLGEGTEQAWEETGTWARRPRRRPG